MMASFLMNSLVSLVAITSIFSYSSAASVPLGDLWNTGKKFVVGGVQEVKKGMSNAMHEIGLTQMQHSEPEVLDNIQVPDSLQEAIEKGAYYVGKFLAKKYFGPGGEKGFQWGVKAKKLYVAGEGVCEQILSNHKDPTCPLTVNTTPSQHCYIESIHLCIAEISHPTNPTKCQYYDTCDFNIKPATWCTTLEQSTSLDPSCGLKTWYNMFYKNF